MEVQISKTLSVKNVKDKSVTGRIMGDETKMLKIKTFTNMKRVYSVIFSTIS